jgi:molecular chaperone DnaK
MVREAEENAEADKAKPELVETKNQAESLVHATEKSLEEHGDKVDPIHGRGDRTGGRQPQGTDRDRGRRQDQGRHPERHRGVHALGEAIYKAQQEDADGGDPSTDDDDEARAGDDDIVDADFEDLDDDRKRS